MAQLAPTDLGIYDEKDKNSDQLEAAMKVREKG
jgi:hypothetical protein